MLNKPLIHFSPSTSFRDQDVIQLNSTRDSGQSEIARYITFHKRSYKYYAKMVFVIISIYYHYSQKHRPARQSQSVCFWLQLFCTFAYHIATNGNIIGMIKSFFECRLLATPRFELLSSSWYPQPSCRYRSGIQETARPKGLIRILNSSLLGNDGKSPVTEVAKAFGRLISKQRLTETLASSAKCDARNVDVAPAPKPGLGARKKTRVRL
jgi:hypothetical protein